MPSAMRLRIISTEPRDDETWVELAPSTGVMHQLRATLAELGHPVVGDRIYGRGLVNMKAAFPVYLGAVEALQKALPECKITR